MSTAIGPRRRLLIFVSILTSFILIVALRSYGDVEFWTEDTNYPIPGNSIFVAVDGDDSNVGTEAEPLRTVGAAIQLSSAGGTIVIREGTYRTGDHIISKRLTLQPYPHETVLLKGSLVLTNWIQEGTYWRHDNWTYQFDQNSYDSTAIDPAYPHAGKPDMVFVDWLPLDQVGDLAQLSGNAFYVDYATNQLYISVDPNNRTVEAAAHIQALYVATAAADNTIIRGLGFMHYAGNRYEGTLHCENAKVTFENNTVAWSASRGIAINNSTHVRVQGNSFFNNGLMGLAAWQTEYMTVERNRFIGNNQERFAIASEAAEASGAKITASSQLVVRDNDLKDNFGNGLWFDISIFEAVVVNNSVQNNSAFGILYEISANGIIAGNLVVGNEHAGIALSNSSDVWLYNNTFADNSVNVAVFDDSRVNPDDTQFAQGITWITSDVVIKNNIMSNSDGTSPFFYARDFNSIPLKDAEDMITAVDFNAYYRTNSLNPMVLVEWWRSASYNGFEDLKMFKSDTGNENRGFAIDDNRANPFFVDELSGDYRLQESSVARGAGSPLPREIASVLGIPPFIPVDLGAFQYDMEMRDYLQPIRFRPTRKGSTKHAKTEHRLHRIRIPSNAPTTPFGFHVLRVHGCDIHDAGL